MFICDCHCDTLTELYKKGTSLYDNDQHFDIKRQIELGGGLQFCAIFVPTHEFRYYGGLRYTLCLLDKYKQELKALQEKGIDVLPVLTKADAADVLNHKAATLLAIEEGGAIDGSLEALRMLYELGVRAMTLTWSNRNDIADGVNEECSGGGLTTFGRQVVAERTVWHAGRRFPYCYSWLLGCYRNFYQADHCYPFQCQNTLQSSS